MSRGFASGTTNDLRLRPLKKKGARENYEFRAHRKHVTETDRNRPLYLRNAAGSRERGLRLVWRDGSPASAGLRLQRRRFAGLDEFRQHPASRLDHAL